MSAPAENDEPQGRCAIHPERAAAGLCSRCGSYFCDDCASRTSLLPLCAACARRGGTEGLAKTREECWGKRDSWVWFFGLLGSVGSTLNLVGVLVQARYASAVAISAHLVVAIAYFLLLPWARRALFVTLVLSPFAALVEPAQALPGVSAQAAVVFRNVALIVSTGVGALLIWLAYRSPRNKLAFRIEIPEHELREVHRQLGSANALRALVYGVLSLAIPLVGIVGIVFALSTFRRIERSKEPVGNRKRLALAGLVLSIIGTLLWLAAIAALILMAMHA